MQLLTDESVVQVGGFGSAYESRGRLPGNADPRLYALTGVLSLAYPIVGALIASRLPTNPIGWILCGAGVLYTGQRFTIAYADYALLENHAFPGGELMAWVSNAAENPGTVVAGVFLMLLFPDGRLLSRRWQIVAWMAVCGAVVRTVGMAFFRPGPLMTHVYVQNPFEIPLSYFWFPGSDYVLRVADWLADWSVVLVMSGLAALFSFFLRLHRAQGVERQQLKWCIHTRRRSFSIMCPRTSRPSQGYEVGVPTSGLQPYLP